MNNELPPAILVIFGITGDLSKRYLLPALYHLCKDNLLGEHHVIVGTSRKPLDVDEFLKTVEVCVLESDKVCDPVVLKRFRDKLQTVQLDPTLSEDYARLHQTLDAIEDSHKVCIHRMYYLSIPPQIYPPVVKHLGENGLNQSCQHGNADTRLLVEKPFGYDLTSAEELISSTAEHFREDQVYRIDHYLAKDTVRHILPFRQENPELEKMWNSTHVSRIDINAFEAIGIEGRQFYDQIGALRDFVQSHLMQLLAVTTMDLPEKLDSDPIHAAKQKLLESIIPAEPEQAVRGQYETYRQEVNNNDSATETFASVELQINSERWRSVPVHLTTGKALPEKRAEIIVTFGDAELKFEIQPNPHIDATSGVTELVSAPLNVTIADKEQAVAHDNADAYELVLASAIRADKTLFISSEEVLASWRILEPIVRAWEKNSDGLINYKNGSLPDKIS